MIEIQEKYASDSGLAIESSSNGWKEATKGDISDHNMLDELENPENFRKFVQEAILLAGGATAILLQVAEPSVGKGVDAHSNFAYRPMDRLRTTMTYVYCMAFGSRSEKEAVIHMVHRAHSVVKGPDYSADDPELQLWVAATLYAVGIELYQQMFGTMAKEDAEAIFENTRFSRYPCAFDRECGPCPEEHFGSTGTTRLRQCKSLEMQKELPMIFFGTRSCQPIFAAFCLWSA